MFGNSDKGIDADLWFIAQRWQQYEGEQRANALRIMAIGAFYIVHLLNYYQPFGLFELDPKPDERFHQAVTLIAVAWTMLGVGVDLCLRQRIFPRYLSLVTTACDLLFLTALLCLGEGQSSPLILGYPLIIILAALRVSLPLVRCATVGSVAGYLFVVGVTKWGESIGPDRTTEVPRYAQIMTLLAIALGGIILGQLLRGVRGMAEEFSVRRAAAAAGPSTDRDQEDAS